jgi:hypothetical protein
LLHVPGLTLEATGSWRNDPLSARQAILRHLRAALPGTWHALDALAARVKRQQPDFARGEFDTWYVRDAATGDYLRGFEAWDKVEGALIRHVVTRPLLWLGVVEAGAGEFSVTQLGAALLGLAQAGAPAFREVATSYLVRADATVSVSASRRYDRFQLARVADFVSAGDEYVYRLSPTSLARARAQKIGPARIVESLQHASGAELPPPVLTAIRRWSDKGVEATIERAIVLHVKSPAILRALQSSPKTRGLIGPALGPTAARIEEKHWRRLRGALAEMGLLADVEAI